MNVQKYSSFDNESLFHERQSVFVDFSQPSDVLLVAFGGISGGMMIPPFEFFNVASNFKFKKIFIRDLHQAWFQKGLLGINGVTDVTTMRDYMHEKIKESGCKKIVFVGNSAGGFAALLFGKLLNVDEVHAFVPQTFIDLENREKFDEMRWEEEIQNYIYDHTLNTSFFDLVQAYKAVDNVYPSWKFWKRQKTISHIYYDHNFEPDRKHGERLKDFMGVVIHKSFGGEHEIVRDMKRNGKLFDIISSFVG